MFFRRPAIRIRAMALTWEVWRGVSAAVAGVLVVLLLVRHVFEMKLRESHRRAIDVATIPLFGFFVFYIASDLLGILP